MAPAVEDGGEQGDERELGVAHELEHVGADLGQPAEVAGADAALALNKRDDGDDDYESKVAAADEQVAFAFAAGFDDAEENGVGGDQTPGVFNEAEPVFDRDQGQADSSAQDRAEHGAPEIERDQEAHRPGDEGEGDGG